MFVGLPVERGVGVRKVQHRGDLVRAQGLDPKKVSVRKHHKRDPVAIFQLIGRGCGGSKQQKARCLPVQFAGQSA